MPTQEEMERIYPRIISEEQKRVEELLLGKITELANRVTTEEQREIARLEKTATEQDNCILHFQARVAALKAEIERLKFGREPLPCPRADK